MFCISAYFWEEHCYAINTEQQQCWHFSHNCSNYLDNMPGKTIPAECWMHFSLLHYRIQSIHGFTCCLAQTCGVHFVVGLDSGQVTFPPQTNFVRVPDVVGCTEWRNLGPHHRNPGFLPLDGWPIQPLLRLEIHEDFEGLAFQGEGNLNCGLFFQPCVNLGWH